MLSIETGKVEVKKVRKYRRKWWFGEGNWECRGKYRGGRWGRLGGWVEGRDILYNIYKGDGGRDGDRWINSKRDGKGDGWRVRDWSANGLFQKSYIRIVWKYPRVWVNYLTIAKTGGKPHVAVPGNQNKKCA